MVTVLGQQNSCSAEQETFLLPFMNRKNIGWNGSLTGQLELICEVLYKMSAPLVKSSQILVLYTEVAACWWCTA